MQLPSHSPWGEIQQCTVLCPGAYSVGTAGHGGVMLEKEIAASLSEEARKVGFSSGSYLCFEEDCDAPVALRELIDRQLYTPSVNERYAPEQYEKQINNSLQSWHKDYWQTRQTRIAQQSLSEYCYSCLASTGEIVILKCGESGYYKTDMPATPKRWMRNGP